MRTGAIVGLTLLSVGAGVVAGEVTFRSKICRDAIGRCCGRGHLLVLVNGRGIYENDTKLENVADQYFAGGETPVPSPDAILKRMIANENVRQLSIHEPVSELERQRDYGLLQDQFGDDNLWRKRLQAAGISARKLQELLHEHIGGHRWVERSLVVSSLHEQTLRDYYAQHLRAFMQPIRFRASHIFLAAPPETAPEVVEAKKELIELLASRLRGGEEFDALVWEASEDEATKPRGGDLGYFCEWRIPPDFFSVLSQLKIGDPPKTFRTALGFHIVRLTEVKPSRQMSFDEARPEVVARLRNAHRREAVENLAARLSGSSALRGGWFWN